MRLLPICAVCLLTTACAADGEIEIGGRIGLGAGAMAPGIVGAELEILDADTETSLALTTTEDMGAFTVTVPVGRSIVAIIRSDETATTAIFGTTGFGSFTVADGDLFGLPTEVLDTWRSDFAGCPDVDARTVVLGEGRFVNLVGEGTGESPIASDLRVNLLSNETTFLPCYLNDDGVYDAMAGATGATGRFAFFGVPDGSGILDPVFEHAPGLFDTPGLQTLYLPEGDEDVVVPYLPLRLFFPY